MIHPVRLKEYGRPRTPAPTMAMKTLAKVLDWEERGLGLAMREGFGGGEVLFMAQMGVGFSCEFGGFVGTKFC